jgi:DNA-binding PadR family transcriptional regulator
VVILVGGLSHLSIDSGRNPLDILLDQVLTPTDFKIIHIVTRLRSENGRAPTASDIKEGLSAQLKKTQLYDRLNRLSRLGFLAVKLLPRPRRYLVNKKTITQGVERWVEEQRASIMSISSELESLRNFLNGLNAKSFASVITEKLSMDFESAQ